jgi:hypothetical protein
VHRLKSDLTLLPGVFKIMKFAKSQLTEVSGTYPPTIPGTFVGKVTALQGAELSIQIT